MQSREAWQKRFLLSIILSILILLWCSNNPEHEYFWLAMASSGCLIGMCFVYGYIILKL